MLAVISILFIEQIPVKKEEWGGKVHDESLSTLLFISKIPPLSFSRLSEYNGADNPGV